MPVRGPARPSWRVRRALPMALALVAALIGCSIVPNLGELRPGSYLPGVLLEGRSVVHFVEMPVRVRIDTYAPPPGYKELYRQQVLDALGRWEAASEGLLSFVEVSSFPDITVLWVSQIASDPGATGVTTITYDRTCFTSPIVELATHVRGQQISDEEMAATIIHELGHAIGMAGHSSGVDDVMYASSTATELSEADRATLLDLYSRPTQRMKCHAVAAAAGWRTVVLP